MDLNREDVIEAPVQEHLQVRGPGLNSADKKQMTSIGLQFTEFYALHVSLFSPDHTTAVCLIIRV